MRGGRGRLPVLAELVGPAGEGSGPWSIRREDFEAMAALTDRLGKARSLLVTGGEESSPVLAVQLAAVATAVGRRVALVDCDLGRARLAVDLGLAATPGLHEYLRWEATPEQILQPLVLTGSAADGGEPLVCIAAGRPAADPGTLLGLGSFRHMTAKLARAYDLVVLSGPALAAGGQELASLAAGSDAVLAGVGPGQAEGRLGRALAEAVTELPAPGLGAVVVGAA